MTALKLIGSMARTRIGLWQYLAARSADRTRLELERERSRSGLSVLAAMPPGAMVLDIGPGGMRVIKMPDQHIAAIGIPRGSTPDSSGQ
jgi:hypothetical protein